MTKPSSGTDRPDRAGTAAKPICRRLFSIDQAADCADVPVQVIYRWIRMGKLELYDLGRGRVRIDELELADLISGRDSDHSQRQGRPDGSNPRFASAETSRS